MIRTLLGNVPLLALSVSASIFGVGLGFARPADTTVHYLDQGRHWTPSTRADFYTSDQGSQLIKLSWLQALTQSNGEPFLEGALTRYGYLPNPAAKLPLPIGFTVSSSSGEQVVGMTCAACHTRQIDVDGTSYRIDGGPALSDFQTFLTDLDQAVGRVLSSDASFRGFATAVLGSGATAEASDALKHELGGWYERQHALFSKALPAQPWGVGRLDAVSMIFDRVSGLDIGLAPNGIIEGNIYPADAPVRYPFIWDAPMQDKTQWPGFADNGDTLFGLVRNLGEVYGVFADFHPVKSGGLLGYDYHTHNSANFKGLNHLESLVRDIGPPAWPWAIDPDSKARGAALFVNNCSGCHGIADGAVRFLPLSQTWRTPIEDVQTDTREYDVLKRSADSGVLQGALYPPGKPLMATDKQFNILAAAVVGSLADDITRHGLPKGSLLRPLNSLWLLRRAGPLKTPDQELASAFHTEAVAMAAPGDPHPYEARVLRGIWATAPYLHNGSVPSLSELLKPDAQRVQSFAVGTAYDPKTIGLAEVQRPGAPVRITTDCSDRNSGNSRCGHNYGTALSPPEKADLLEFLKSL